MIEEQEKKEDEESGWRKKREEKTRTSGGRKTCWIRKIIQGNRTVEKIRVKQER